MKTKKILFIFLTILCFGFSTFALASCGEQPTSEPHVHEWVESETVKPATCTETGLSQFTCKSCEETKVDIISAKGHIEVIKEAVESTCSSYGLTEGKYCSECHKVFIAPTKVNMKNHNYIDYICSECGYNYYTEGLEFTLSENDENYYVSLGTAKDTNIVIPSVYQGKPVLIGDLAFYFCTSLTSITICDGVTSIGTEAFSGCSLTSITIPKSVTSIGVGAFISCQSLENIVVDSDNRYYDSRNNCNAIIETETNTLVTGCKNSTIPDSVPSIGSYAFAGCSLTSITIPKSVTSIGVGAFAGCQSLENIVVDSDNRYYDSRNNCNAIIETETNTLVTGCKNSTIPDSVTSIGECSFYLCSSLKSITIPDSVTSIGDRAFVNCWSLTSITIPDSVTSIGDSAFSGCSSLKTIYYTGTEEQWNTITIEDNNSYLTKANIIYNYKG